MLKLETYRSQMCCKGHRLRLAVDCSQVVMQPYIAYVDALFVTHPHRCKMALQVQFT